MVKVWSSSDWDNYHLLMIMMIIIMIMITMSLTWYRTNDCQVVDPFKSSAIVFSTEGGLQCVYWRSWLWYMWWLWQWQWWHLDNYLPHDIGWHDGVGVSQLPCDPHTVVLVIISDTIIMVMCIRIKSLIKTNHHGNHRHRHHVPLFPQSKNPGLHR